MPFGDRTGPLGYGPRTGRAMGYCTGFPGPGSMNPVPGQGWFGFGRGQGRGWFGGGRGWRNCYWVTGLPGWARYGYTPFWGYPYAPTAKEEMDILRAQAEFLRKEMDEIQNRISTLEKSQAEDKERVD